ncbi:MAG: hypothetical protein WC989_00555 [Micavibrio sp.]
MKNLIAISAFALLFCMAPAALHAQVTGEEARVTILKGQIEGFIDAHKARALRHGGKLDSKGSVTVEKAGNYYAFTLPHLSFTDAKGVRSEIGMIALNASPRANGEWSVSLAIPTPIKSFGHGGGEMFRTDIDTQQASGIWNERLGHFSALKGDYGNVRLNNLVDQGTVTIGALSIRSQLSPQSGNDFTGKTYITFDNISAYDAGTAFRAIVPHTAIEGDIKTVAASSPMTREQVRSRPQNASFPDGYNIVASLIGAPEKAQVTVKGLDAVNAQLQQSLITATPSHRAKILQSILAVSTISGLGRPVQGDTSAKLYEIVFGANGSIALNGTDFGTLLQTTNPGGGIPVLR